MKAIITQKSELTLNLMQHFTFDILSDEGEEVLTSQSVECSPSNAVNEIRNKVAAFEEEYQKSQSLEIGTEIDW
jgi:hypothetical protein